jgi:hypothetical protein
MPRAVGGVLKPPKSDPVRLSFFLQIVFSSPKITNGAFAPDVWSLQCVNLYTTDRFLRLTRTTD